MCNPLRDIHTPSGICFSVWPHSSTHTSCTWLLLFGAPTSFAAYGSIALSPILRPVGRHRGGYVVRHDVDRRLLHHTGTRLLRRRLSLRHVRRQFELALESALGPDSVAVATPVDSGI